MTMRPCVFGVSLMDDEGNWTLDTPEMHEATEYIDSFFKDGITGTNLDVTPGVSITQFVNGETPIMTGGPTTISQIADQGGDPASYATAVIPKDESSTSFVGGADFGVFMLVPLLSSMGMSFTDITSRDLRTPFNVNIVGFDNYVTLLTDPRFHKALLTTAIFVIVGLSITIAIAMAFAVALNKGLKHLNAFFRAVFYAPVVASVVAVSVVWRYILQDDGLLNSLLAVFGIDGPDWLHDTRFALPALMIMTIWRNMGTLMIIFLAGLQAIPTELKEAASVDGAGKWRTFTSITLPLMKPTILLGAVLISVAYLQFFEESFVMTQGGPLDSTLSAAYYVYQQFGFGRYGIASAASWVLFIIIAVVSVLQFRILGSDE